MTAFPATVRESILCCNPKLVQSKHQELQKAVNNKFQRRHLRHLVVSPRSAARLSTFVQPEIFTHPLNKVVAADLLSH